MSDVTPILSQIERGDPIAAEQLLPLVYAASAIYTSADRLADFCNHTRYGRNIQIQTFPQRHEEMTHVAETAQIARRQ